MFLRKRLPLFGLCVNNCLPKLLTVLVTFILYVYLTALTSFSSEAEASLCLPLYLCHRASRLFHITDLPCWCHFAGLRKS